MRRVLLPLLLFTSLVIASDPLAPKDLAAPKDVAARLGKDGAKGPLVLQIGFDVLYRSSHIPGSTYAGPARDPEGIALLKKAVEGQPKDREIVLYCGCCPFDRCPNVRPALSTLREMGFANVRILDLPENFKTDWIDKGYPTDRRLAQ